MILRSTDTRQVWPGPWGSTSERRGSVVERRGSVVVSTSAWRAAGRGFDSWTRHVSLILGVKTCLPTLEIVYL